jgi:hypothetical protein
MPRDGAIIFGDLIGKLDAVNIACATCGRSGHYPLQRVIKARTRDEAMAKFKADPTVSHTPTTFTNRRISQVNATCESTRSPSLAIG